MIMMDYELLGENGGYFVQVLALERLRNGEKSNGMGEFLKRSETELFMLRTPQFGQGVGRPNSDLVLDPESCLASDRVWLGFG